MTAYEYLLVDLITFIYNIAWLVFLVHRHYGQVTTTAGHIFELNVLLNINVNVFLLIIFVDLEVSPWAILSEILDTTVQYSFFAAIAGSQIETIIFLKTLNVNTMMTNTAGKIILILTIFTYGLGVIVTLAFPSNRVKNDILFCEYINPRDFYCFTLPVTVSVGLVLSVIVFGVFRGLQIRKLEQGHETEEAWGSASLNDAPFEVIPELYETPRQIIEEDLVIENLEDDNHIMFMNSMSNIQHNDQQIQIVEQQQIEDQQNQIGCVPVPLPGLNMIMKTIQKYMKNTLISLLILTSQLPWCLTSWYWFFTDSGCEIPAIKAMLEVAEYFWYLFIILTPLLIKLKLDRLSL